MTEAGPRRVTAILPGVSAPRARRRCYVASPLGFTEAGREYYARTMLPALGNVVEVVDPWSLTKPDEFVAAERSNRVREHALRVGQRNLEAIRGCEMLAAVLDGQEADSGTVVEVGYATGLGLRCFGLRSDLRRAGEPGVALNLQVEAIIAHSGGLIVQSLSALLRALANY